MFGFTEHSQDGYDDSAIESVDTVPRAYNSSGVEADEDDPDAWGEPSADPSLIDVVCDDSNIVAGNTGKEIVLICFHILSTNVARGFFNVFGRRTTGFHR